VSIKNLKPKLDVRLGNMSKRQLHLYAKVVFFLALLVAIHHEDGRAQGIASEPANKFATLPAPYKSISYSNPVPKGATTSFFSHKYLIQLKNHTDIHPAPNIYLYNLAGQLEHKLSIWPEGASRLFLSSVDVGANGKLAFAGHVKKDDGTEFNFIATADLDGDSPLYFSTGNYLAMQIAQADDGSLWAIGAEHAQVSGATKLWKNYDTLRHYRSTGKLIEHFFSRWGADVAYVKSTTGGTGSVTLVAYNSQGNPITTNPIKRGYEDAWRQSRQVYLRTAGAQVVLLDGTYNIICERNSIANTSLCENMTGLYANTMRLTGVGLTQDGDVLAGMKASDPSINLLRGLFLLAPPKTDNNGIQWAIVQGTESSSPTIGDFYDLLGIDGNSVVYRMREGRRRPKTVYESTW
jgi:hypothetical protein